MIDVPLPLPLPLPAAAVFFAAFDAFVVFDAFAAFAMVDCECNTKKNGE